MQFENLPLQPGSSHVASRNYMADVKAGSFISWTEAQRQQFQAVGRAPVVF
jgi:hypothetical protein